MHARRFQSLPMPDGWFHALHSEDLAPGSVEPLRYLGQDLVAFRGEDGRATILDAYCPHLGAHLGRGGKVEGNMLRCPFHGWAFSADGHCADVPYATRIPRGASARVYPTIERNGAIFFWSDAQGASPRFEVPEIPETPSGA